MPAKYISLDILDAHFWASSFLLYRYQKQFKIHTQGFYNSRFEAHLGDMRANLLKEAHSFAEVRNC